MRQETEKLIYSIQDKNYTCRGSIQEAQKELQTTLDDIPIKYSALMQVKLQVLLNSIVAEVMAIENKVYNDLQKELDARRL